MMGRIRLIIRSFLPNLSSATKPCRCVRAVMIVSAVLRILHCKLLSSLQDYTLMDSPTNPFWPTSMGNTTVWWIFVNRIISIILSLTMVCLLTNKTNSRWMARWAINRWLERTTASNFGDSWPSVAQKTVCTSVSPKWSISMSIATIGLRCYISNRSTGDIIISKDSEAKLREANGTTSCLTSIVLLTVIWTRCLIP